MKCETCAHFKACKRLIDERYEELVPCEEYQSVYTVDAAPMGHSCWDYPTVIKGHEIPVPHCRRCGTHNTDKSKYCPECGACMDGNKATGYTPEECAAAFEELAACRAAEQNGTLLQVPCKIGDTVWTNFSISGSYLKRKNRPYACTVIFIGLNQSDSGGYINVQYNGSDYQFSFDFAQIGKTVFLTREAAEAALKEQNSANMVKTP